MKCIWGFVFVAHGLEGAFAFTLARKHRMPLGTAVRIYSSSMHLIQHSATVLVLR